MIIPPDAGPYDFADRVQFARLAREAGIARTEEHYQRWLAVKRRLQPQRQFTDAELADLYKAWTRFYVGTRDANRLGIVNVVA